MQGEPENLTGPQTSCQELLIRAERHKECTRPPALELAGQSVKPEPDKLREASLQRGWRRAPPPGPRKHLSAEGKAGPEPLKPLSATLPLPSLSQQSAGSQVGREQCLSPGLGLKPGPSCYLDVPPQLPPVGAVGVKGECLSRAQRGACHTRQWRPLGFC